MTSVKFWLWLTTRMELSIGNLYRLLERFETPEMVYYAASAEYDALNYLRPVTKGSLRDKSMEPVDRILADCDRLNVRICTIQDAEYPERLRQIYEPPAVLYLQGAPIRFDDEAAIAVAGTRNCSEYGRHMADKLGFEITRGGGLVVTGVVPGCDYAAVTGALRAGGPVACVLAGGVDVAFDHHSHALYRRILQNGILVTEYPPGREPAGRNFPMRNRILTGLCAGVLCVEGRVNSGTMIVAKYAADQNRDLFVVPTGADHPEGSGVLALLKDGAAPVTEGEEILSNYRIRYREKLPAPRSVGEYPLQPPPVRVRKKPDRPRKQEPEPAPAQSLKPAEPAGLPVLDGSANGVSLNEGERAVLTALQAGGKTGDELVDACGLPSRQILAVLTTLTIQGYVKEEAGGAFCAAVRLKEESEQ